MKKHTQLLSLLVILALVLGACGGAAPAVVETQAPPTEPVAPPPTEVPAPPPTEAPTPEPPKPPLDLDAHFNTFISGMVAYNTISPAKLNEMLTEGQDVFMLDVREANELAEKGWIEGAVHIPMREVASSTQYLPSYDTTIVSYCGSGWRCAIVLTALEAMGWENVLGMVGGSFGGWVTAGYPFVTGEIPPLVERNEAMPEEQITEAMDAMLKAVPDGYGVAKPDAVAVEMIESPDLIFIDVRTAAEVEGKGYIDSENVLFIPLEELIASQDMLPQDKDARIVVYCGTAHRSTIAMTILWSYGYTDVHSLQKGFGEWTAAGYPVKGGTVVLDLDSPFTRFLSGMIGYNTVSIDTLQTMMIEEEDFFLLDVREPNELADKGWIAGAVNVPLRQLGANLDKLPSFDTTIISYCGSGWRCTIALAALEAMGWENVLGLVGGSFGGWVNAGYSYETGTIPAPVVLNEAQPDAAVAGALGTMLASVPDGFGMKQQDVLATDLIENPGLTLIDVRTESEVGSKGYIDAENVSFIPLEEFIANKDQWPQDKNEEIVVYCGSGHRSTIAMTILWTYGYTNVTSLVKGFGEWEAAGYPIVTP